MHSATLNTNQIMRQVIYALALGIAAMFYFFGWGVLLQIVLAGITALACEAVFLKIRKLPILPAISDGSALLSGILLAISIPSIAPWWVVVLGVAFAIIFGKQLYGGLGNNPFNPAMLGYGFLLISYPVQMTMWGGEFLSFSQALNIVFEWHDVDAITAATRLDEVKTQLTLGLPIADFASASVSQMWVNLGFLFGGLYLLLRKVILWHIPVAFLMGVVLTSLTISLGNEGYHLSTQDHLFFGGTMLGAFFIATDPVSASTTPNGRLIYGFLIGVLVVVIRVFGNYPDGIAFAVLLMNITTPLIDYYTQPKVFGR